VTMNKGVLHAPVAVTMNKGVLHAPVAVTMNKGDYEQGSDGETMNKGVMERL